MDTITWMSWCVTRRCDGPAGEAARRLAERIAVDEVVMTPAGRLVVARGRHPGVAAVGPPRTYPARLSFSRRRPAARVTLEVDVWSRTECELVVRPRRRVPWPAPAYYSAAAAVLDALAGALLRGVAAAPGAADAAFRRAS